jgi:hypothetical protein
MSTFYADLFSFKNPLTNFDGEVKVNQEVRILPYAVLVHGKFTYNLST